MIREFISIYGNGSSHSKRPSSLKNNSQRKKIIFPFGAGTRFERRRLERNWRQTRHSLTHSVDGTEIE